MSNRLSFEKKLILTVILTILLPIIITIILMYNIWENTLYQKTDEYLKYVADNIIIKLDKLIADVEGAGIYISEHEILNDYLKNDNQTNADKACALIKNYISNNEIINAVYIIGENVETLDIIKKSGETFNNFTIIESYKKLKEGWYIKQYVPFYIKNIGEKGKIIIEVNADIFYQSLNEIHYKQAKEVYLVNNLGQLIASKEWNTTGNIIPAEYHSFLTKGSSVYENIISSENHIVLVSEELSNGWKLIFSTPRLEYLSDVLFFQYQMTACILVIAVAGLIIIVYVSKQLTRPLKDLANEMNKFGQGDLNSHLEIRTQDEIASLNHTFNQMVGDMKKLIESEYEQKVLKQNAEIRSLQMQINPHFLYNTLDTINWLARMRGMDDVGDITASLGRLMRYSLSKKKYVQIKEEIQNLKDYVEIQEIRYGDKVSVIFQVDKELNTFYIPKLLIQPIVENAIVHGIEGKVDESTVFVKVEKSAQDINIIIEDNGIGISPETLDKILSKEDTKTSGHTSIGITNVNKRIQMVYGKEYGMHIDSIQGKGTKITLHIKKVSDPLSI
ncbi:hypothetical protein AN641_01740 [Candidatus Epulonipiscioides gigas]|nr:hypothetical protein AN641_01740 [Epulopiscium sp. SCG-C07WGA-EpuloA2]